MDSAKHDAFVAAVAEIVHQGHGGMLDALEVWTAVGNWKPCCSMSHEYLFIWKDDLVADLAPSDQLESGPDHKWVDMCYVNDCEGRGIYLLEIGAPPDASRDDTIDSMDAETFDEWHEAAWEWKRQGVVLEGPFASEEAAQAWMSANGVFEEVD